MLVEPYKAYAVFLLCFALGAVWLWTGLRKLRSPLLAHDVTRLVGGPNWLAEAISRGLPLVEIALGAMLVARFHVREAAAASTLLLGIFGVLKTAAMLRASLAGQAVEGECGCFGRWRKSVKTSGGAQPPQEAQTHGSVGAAQNIAVTFALAMVSYIITFYPHGPVIDL
jgi:hypothetical protein